MYLFASVCPMEMHIICILIFTTLIFRICSIHSCVEMEAHSSFCQLSESLYRSSLLPLLLALSFSSHSVLPQSIFCQLFLCVVALCPILLLLTSSLFIFSLSTLYFVLFTEAPCPTCLSPQALCYSCSSTVITAVPSVALHYVA